MLIFSTEANGQEFKLTVKQEKFDVYFLTFALSQFVTDRQFLTLSSNVKYKSLHLVNQSQIMKINFQRLRWPALR